MLKVIGSDGSDCFGSTTKFWWSPGPPKNVADLQLFQGELLIPVAASPVSGEKEARAMASDMALDVEGMLFQWRAVEIPELFGDAEYVK